MDEQAKTRFKYNALLIVIGITLFAGLMNLGSVLKFFSWAVGIVMPILIGLLIAVVLNVPMTGMRRLLKLLTDKLAEKLRKPPSEVMLDVLSLVFTLIGALLLLTLVVSVVLPQLMKSVSGIADTAVKNYPRLLSLLKAYGVDTASIEQWVNALDFRSLLSHFSDNASTLMGKAFSAASSVVGAVVNGFTGFILAIYLLANKKNLLRQTKRLLYAYLKESHADAVCRVASLSADTFFRFISGQCLESCILGGIFFVTMTILRMPYAAVISIFIALTALIPYIGAFLGMLVGFLLIVMVNPLQGVVFLGVFLVIQQLEGQLIYPRVVGNSVGLPAMWTMIAVLVGGAMFGLLGMIFFIPLTSVLYTLLRTHMNRRLEEKHIDPDTKEF